MKLPALRPPKVRVFLCYRLGGRNCYRVVVPSSEKQARLDIARAGGRVTDSFPLYLATVRGRRCWVSVP
jgi:hypothetical protein